MLRSTSSPVPAFAALALVLSGCGEASQSGRIGAAHDSIVGGAPDSTHPEVLLLYTDPTFGPCSATLVAPDLLLTARHCVSLETGEVAFCGNASDPATGFDLPVYGADRAPSELGVSIVPDGPAVAHGVKIFHDASDTTCRHDLALFQIEPPITGIEPAPVRRSPPVVGEALTVAGWGYIDDAQTQSADVLRSKDVDVLAVGPIDYAFHPYGDAGSPLQDQAVVENELLVTIGTSAQGDSGAPGFDADGAIVGTVARGYPTPSYGPSTLSAVQAHLVVIDEAFAAVGYDPGAGAGGAGGEGVGAGPSGGGGDAATSGETGPSASDASASDDGGCSVGSAPRSGAMGAALALAALALAAALRKARPG